MYILYEHPPRTYTSCDHLPMRIMSRELAHFTLIDGPGTRALRGRPTECSPRFLQWGVFCRRNVISITFRWNRCFIGEITSCVIFYTSLRPPAEVFHVLQTLLLCAIDACSLNLFFLSVCIVYFLKKIRKNGPSYTHSSSPSFEKRNIFTGGFRSKLATNKWTRPTTSCIARPLDCFIENTCDKNIHGFYNVVSNMHA